MNRDNLLKLRAALEVLPPEKFDYSLLPLRHSECGCVIYHARCLFGDRLAVNTRCVLGLAGDEYNYILGRVEPEIDPTPHESYLNMGKRATGAAGIAEAIRRIDVLLAREEQSA
jgi:hypothetical protein